MHVLQNAFVAAFLILSGLYLGVSLGSAVLVARRKGWEFLPILPVVFAAYQLPYALGFLAGFFYQGQGPRLPKSPPKAIALNPR
jgi:hypothetical protein